MHEYDTALKLLLQGSANVALKRLTGETIARWLNVELPEVRNTRVDLLGETTGGGLVHVELQSRNDGRMALRMAEYCLSVYRLFNRFPRQILIYVGDAPLRMDSELAGPDLSFRYELMDIREVDGGPLLESRDVSDNVIAILTRLDDEKTAIRRILGSITRMEPAKREQSLRQLLIVAGLRRLEDVVEEEARKMPILDDILDHKVLGREFKRGLEEGRLEGRDEGREEGVREGEIAILRRLIEKRFGTLPQWASERLAGRSAAELEQLSERLLDASTIEDLLGS